MESRRRLIGSSPHAVALAGSKLATAQTLLAAGVPAVPTWRIEDASIAGACVVKPDDGCGCDQTRRFASLHAARSWVALQPHPSRFVVQPYVPGDALSLSVVGGAEGSALLSVNRQRVALRDDVFEFHGCLVNAIDDAEGKLARLAACTLAAIPGALGYLGIDVVSSEQGPVVIEVNPRLTTSYVGLREAIGINPAGVVLGLSDCDVRRAGTQSPRTVEVRVSTSEPA